VHCFTVHHASQSRVLVDCLSPSSRVGRQISVASAFHILFLCPLVLRKCSITQCTLGGPLHVTPSDSSRTTSNPKKKAELRESGLENVRVWCGKSDRRDVGMSTLSIDTNPRPPWQTGRIIRCPKIGRLFKNEQFRDLCLSPKSAIAKFKSDQCARCCRRERRAGDGSQCAPSHRTQCCESVRFHGAF
jgi:hypothetical protein